MTAGTATAAPRPGLDGAWLHALWQPWREWHAWPPATWLTPQPRVRLLHADGGESVWAGARRLPDGARGGRFVAVEVPESMRLDLPLAMPPLAPAALRDAVALEVRAASPFAADDLSWGWTAVDAPGGDGVAVQAVLASRRAVQAQLQAAAARLTPDARPEAWALAGGAVPVVVAGWGEDARERHRRFGRRLGAALLALALLLGAAVAATPTAQLKWRARQAVAQHGATEQRLAPVVALRERLVRQQDDVRALREQLADHVEALTVIEQVTQMIPDDTFLQRLQVQGAKVTATGQTPNTAALMNTLSTRPGLRDVKAPAAATRAAEGRENFTIEWQLDPALRQPALAALAAPAAPARP